MILLSLHAFPREQTRKRNMLRSANIENNVIDNLRQNRKMRMKKKHPVVI